MTELELQTKMQYQIELQDLLSSLEGVLATVRGLVDGTGVEEIVTSLRESVSSEEDQELI